MQCLEPVDLLFRIRLGQQSLLGCLDPERQHLPHWCCWFNHGDLFEFKEHDCWDFCHDVARAIHGLSMAEEVTGEHIDDVIIADLSNLFFALFDPQEDLPGTLDATGNRFVHLHNIREATHALTALLRRGDVRAKDWSQRMIHTLRKTLDEKGQIHLDRLPESVKASGEYTSQPHQEGRAVDALVRHYRISGNTEALEVASLMTAFALDHCFTPEGKLTAAVGTHGHSINALVAGMLDLALLTSDAVLLRRAKAVYDVGLSQFNSSFGWSMEMLDRHLRGEANNTGDLIRGALLLGRAGFPEYFERAERILRSQLLPSQLIDVENLSDAQNENECRHHLASRIRGGFSFPLPNDHLYQADDVAIVTYDVTSGAVDALVETWNAAIIEDVARIYVNLLLTCHRNGVRVTSHLPEEGRIDIENTTHRNLLIRVPSWVSPEDFRLTVNGLPLAMTFTHPFLLVPAMDDIQNVCIRFQMSETRTVEMMDNQLYTIDWRGDHVAPSEIYADVSSMSWSRTRKKII
jgi:hypothetical protein